MATGSPALTGGVPTMLVAMLDAEDAFLSISNTCAIGVSDPEAGTTIDRRVVRESDGVVVQQLAADIATDPGVISLTLGYVVHQSRGGHPVFIPVPALAGIFGDTDGAEGCAVAKDTIHYFTDKDGLSDEECGSYCPGCHG